MIEEFSRNDINADGIDNILIEFIQSGDIEKAKKLFQNRDEEVLKAISEYSTSSHLIMNRLDKERKGSEPYRTEKLPIAWQKYINDVSVFFMFAKPVIWKEENPAESTKEAFKTFEKFLKDTRFFTNMREAKRRAGAETESAKIYHIYKDKNEAVKVKVMVVSKSLGYTLRPLFDSYGDMIAFAYGYFLKEKNKKIEHFDIMMDNFIYKCKRIGSRWDIEAIINHIGKIPVIYYQQEKEWDGVQERIERDEMLDSTQADTNNYFADPIAKITANILHSLPDAEQVGKLIQLQSKDDVFEYVEPPTATEMRDSEKKNLRETILLNSFTPDFTYENMKGTGTLSGEAMKRAMIVGYIKRDNRMEIYDELLDREKNIILAIMKNVTHINMANQIEKLEILHELSEPFASDTESTWSAVGKAYTDNVMSLETAVEQIGIADSIEEVRRLKEAMGTAIEEQIYPPGAS